MSLQNASISELTTESGTFKLLNEWLGQWFDGQAHTLGASAMVFPKVNRAFGQGEAVQPMHQLSQGTDAEIRLVLHSRAESAASNDTVLYQGKLVTDYVILNFWVSAKKPGPGQSDYLAQSIAEKLKALLTNPDARYELAERGITHLQPQGPPQVIASADYARRLVNCNAQLTYVVQYGDQVVTGTEMPGAMPGAVQTVNFFREAPLLVNTYLLGYYRWSVRVAINSVRVTAWAPQGEDVMLALEVDGTLTGPRVTIPQGEANTEVTAEVTFQNVSMAPGQAVRWKVISGPDPEAAAWNANLVMEVQSAS
jgi:hypothetical protein